MQRIGLQRGQEQEQKKIDSSLAVIIFVRCQLRWDSTNKIIDEYLDTELGVDWIDAYLE